MSAITDAQLAEREMRVTRMLAAGKSMVEIAAVLGISKQAVWQFCALRGMIESEAARRWAAGAEERNQQRRIWRRREAEARAKLVKERNWRIKRPKKS